MSKLAHKWYRIFYTLLVDAPLTHYDAKAINAALPSMGYPIMPANSINIQLKRYQKSGLLDNNFCPTDKLILQITEQTKPCF